MTIWGTGILKGMAITIKNMFRGPITVQYPREKLVLPERARWAVTMKLDEEGEHKCTGCLACERACPDYIIKIDVTTDENRNKHIDRWRYDIGACMMCGLCVEACPFDAICMGKDYELARFSPDELTTNLLEDVPAAKPKRKAAEDRPARPKPADKPASEEPAAADTPATACELEPAADPTAVEPILGDPNQQGGQPVDETARSTPTALASEESCVNSEKLEVEPAPTHEEASGR